MLYDRCLVRTDLAIGQGRRNQAVAQALFVFGWHVADHIFCAFVLKLADFDFIVFRETKVVHRFFKKTAFSVVHDPVGRDYGGNYVTNGEVLVHGENRVYQTPGLVELLGVMRSLCTVTLVAIGLIGCGPKPSAKSPPVAQIASGHAELPLDDTPMPSEDQTPSKEPAVLPAQDEVAKAPISIPNGRLYDGYVLGGLPSKKQFDDAYAAGFESAMSLMDNDEEGIRDIAPYASSLGVRYIRFTVRDKDDLNESMAWQFASTLGMLGRPAIIHSAGGERAGAMFALMAFFVDEVSAAEALAIGKRAGMGSLEAHLRTVLVR